MRKAVILVWMLCSSLGSAGSVLAQLSIGIGLPGVSIGINIPLYPEFVRVPGYPVYYAPQINSNFFFYDGLYWVYEEDNWYASSWYNGPWSLVDPAVVPLFVLRIPVRYYRNPPVYFRGWQADRPPRWGEHWGIEWQQRRSGWDRWYRNTAPAPAPLPTYQRQFSGNRYPEREQQRELQSRNYRYQPRDAVVRQHYQEEVLPKASVPRTRQSTSPERDSRPEDSQKPYPQVPVLQNPPSGQRPQPPQKGAEDRQKAAPPSPPPQQRLPAVQEPRQPSSQGGAQRDQQAPRARQEIPPQSKGAGLDERRGPDKGQERGQDKGRDKEEERGQDRKR